MELHNPAEFTGHSNTVSAADKNNWWKRDRNAPSQGNVVEENQHAYKVLFFSDHVLWGKIRPKTKKLYVYKHCIGDTRKTHMLLTTNSTAVPGKYLSS